MDKTNEYILQCEKAEEVQKLRYGKREKFDHVAVFHKEWKEVDEFTKKAEYELYSVERYITDERIADSYDVWLPRQDQLQKMLDDDVDKLCKRIFDWIEFTYPVMGGMDFEPKSMEQLWLAFVMFEKFGKVWSNNDWKKKK